MIDTIKGYLNIYQDPIQIDQLKDILEKPSLSKPNDSDYGYLNGKIKNFKISIHYNINSEKITRVSFEGSIPKFLYGNNIAQCSAEDIESVMDALSDSLRIDLSPAKITRLDVGFNFLVSNPVSYYISSINSYPRLLKINHENETVTFSSKSKARTVLFYDKLKEMKDKGNKEALSSLSDFINDNNILRFEVRFQKHFDPQLKIERVTFLDLCSKDTHRTLVNILIDTYNKVEFGVIEIPSEILVSGRGGLKSFLALIGLKEYGHDRLLSLIKNQEFDVKNPAVKRSILKKHLRELVSSNDEILHLSVKNELESKLGALYINLI
jgi:hypothetical protein